jgi:hypothetical protein
MVTARKGPGGKFMRDPMPHYDRGRTLVEPARRSSEDPGDVAS